MGGTEEVNRVGLGEYRFIIISFSVLPSNSALFDSKLALTRHAVCTHALISNTHTLALTLASMAAHAAIQIYHSLVAAIAATAASRARTWAAGLALAPEEKPAPEEEHYSRPPAQPQARY